MNDIQYYEALSKCVRCGACKALCPTYLSSSDEAMGARGRIAMLGALKDKALSPTRTLSDKIFSCILCEACKGLCPTGINIPETIYHGRRMLKDSYTRGKLAKKTLKFTSYRLDTVFPALRTLQKLFYPLLHSAGFVRYVPDISSTPFKNSAQVYKGKKNIGRVALFAGCSVNYFYPRLGDSLLKVLLSSGYEIVVLKGEMCCGAPMRSLGLEEEAVKLAKKNIELFNKMRVGAILSMCPTCTMTIKNQYPAIAGDSIEKIMDINEFFINNEIARGIETFRRVVTYHDPCHLRYGLGIKDEPREILKSISGITYTEMPNAGECCGFGGFFSMDFKTLSREIGEKKLQSINSTGADTVVTSCPGCMTQLEDLRREANSGLKIMHMVELLDEAMHG